MTRVKVFCEVDSPGRAKTVCIGGRSRQDSIKIKVHADNKHGTQTLRIDVWYDRENDTTHFNIAIPKEWEGRLNEHAIASMVAERLSEGAEETPS